MAAASQLGCTTNFFTPSWPKSHLRNTLLWSQRRIEDTPCIAENKNLATLCPGIYKSQV